MDPSTALVVLVVGVAAIVILTAKVRIHAFLALISVSVMIGLALGLPSAAVLRAVVEGFGGVLGYVGLIALSACIVGELLKETGSTAVISESILKLFGKSRSPLAVSAAGYLVAPPVSCNDTAFLVLSPAARAVGEAGCYSTAFLSLALAAGAYTSFKLVFPAAPLYAATMFHANLADVIVLGFLVSIPVFFVGFLWTRTYMRYGCNHTPPACSRLPDEQSQVRHDRLPSAFEAYGIIATPVMLILGRALVDAFLSDADPLRSAVDFVGHPVVAMMVTVGLGLFAARAYPREKVSQWVSDGVARGASIVAIVGAGGVLGKVLVDANMGKILVSSTASIGVPGAIVVFLIAAVIKTAQGSSVVTMVTAPSVLLPLLPSLGISPTLATLLVSAGAMVSVHVNDSYFWVVTGFSQMSVSEGIKSLTVMSILQGLTVLILTVSIASVWPAI